MAMPNQSALTACVRADLAGWPSLWPPPSPALTVTLVEPMHVLSLRHWPGEGSAALAEVLAAQGLPSLPPPGHASGTEPRLVWCSPSETLLMTSSERRANAVLAALRTVPGTLTCAIDLSSATLVIDLQGDAVDALLTRLVDAQSTPRRAGQASRARLVDITVTAWREAPDHMGILVDRANDRYLGRWLSFAASAV